MNNSVGAQSQLSGLVTSLTVLLTLLFLTPLFYYLPKFALAAVVISSVFPLIAVSEAKKLYKISPTRDFLLWVTAFLGTLFLGVLVGISIAVGFSLLIVIYESARPQIAILWRLPGTTIYRNYKQESAGVFIPTVFLARIGSSLYFANAGYVKEEILKHIKALEEATNVKTEYVILEMTPVVSVDATAVHVLEDLVEELGTAGGTTEAGRSEKTRHSVKVAFAMVGNRAWKTLNKGGFAKKVGEHWFFLGGTRADYMT